MGKKQKKAAQKSSQFSGIFREFFAEAKKSGVEVGSFGYTGKTNIPANIPFLRLGDGGTDPLPLKALIAGKYGSFAVGVRETAGETFDVVITTHNANVCQSCGTTHPRTTVLQRGISLADAQRYFEIAMNATAVEIAKASAAEGVNGIALQLVPARFDDNGDVVPVVKKGGAS